MPQDKFGFEDPTGRYETNRDQLYTDEAEFGRSNASVGWIVGAVVLLGVLVYAFGWKADDQTAGTNPPPMTTGQADVPSARPAPVPGPVGTPAPSTTGSGVAQ